MALMTAWLAIKQFILRPGLALEDIRSRGKAWASAVFGMMALYPQAVLWAEVALPRARNVYLYLLLGAGVATLYFLAVSAMVNGICRLFGGRGHYRDFLSVWGYTYIPGIIGGLLAVAAISGLARHPETAVRIAKGQWAAVLLIVAVMTVLIFLLWDISLKALAIRSVHGVSLGRLILAALVLVVISGLFGSLMRSYVLDSVEFEDLAVFRAMDPALARSAMAREANLARLFGQGTGQVTTSFEVRKLLGGPGRGDVIVFERPETSALSLARVVALPGETVEVRDGRAFVNGRGMPVGGMPTKGARERGGINIPPLTVPESTYYALGDNRALDPASYGGGLVQRERIRGAYLETVLFLQRHGLM